MSVTDPRFGELGQVDEKQLKLLMRDWRRGRADRNIWQALSDGYVFVFALVMIGAMLVSSIIQAQQVVAVCDTAGCLAARGLLPWAAVAGILAFTIVLSRMFGPVLASSAEGFWLMDGPTDRRKLLGGRLVAGQYVPGIARVEGDRRSHDGAERGAHHGLGRPQPPHQVGLGARTEGVQPPPHQFGVALLGRPGCCCLAEPVVHQRPSRT